MKKKHAYGFKQSKGQPAARKDAGGQGIMPSQFAGKKPGRMKAKGSPERAKRSREMRLEGKAL